MEEKIKRIKAGSAVYISDETRNPATNLLFTPNGGVKVDIFDPDGTQVISSQPMTATATGIYAYSWQSNASTSVKGMYTVIITATHGSKASVKEDRKAFELY